jgi:hypothetical protein
MWLFICWKRILNEIQRITFDKHLNQNQNIQNHHDQQNLVYNSQNLICDQLRNYHLENAQCKKNSLLEKDLFCYDHS